MSLWLSAYIYAHPVQTGHNPRILVFSTVENGGSRTPLITLSEHTFGVHCLAFSPDSQYLASMGELNDGFIHVWKIDRRSGSTTLHASNKCTSNTRQIAWLGNSLVTVGTRHVKLWRIQDSYEDVSQRVWTDPNTAAVLSGRNCVLGELMDQVFTAVAAISYTKAVVCSESGDVCILDDSDSVPTLTRFATTGFTVTTIAVQRQSCVLVAGGANIGVMFSFTQILDFPIAETAHPIAHGTSAALVRNDSSVTALGFLENQLVTLDSNRNMNVIQWPTANHPSPDLTECARMSAHSTAVLGVRGLDSVNELRASFLTWSGDGNISFWTVSGDVARRIVFLPDNLDNAREQANQLTTVHTFGNLRSVVAGDRLGFLRYEHSLYYEVLVNRLIRVRGLDTASSTAQIKVHANDITDIAVHERDNTVHIATCGRDRFVQFLRHTSSGLELLQTLDEHVSAVSQVIFSKDGETLVSSSSDRNIIIRHAVRPSMDASPVFIKTRSIALKTTPMSMAFDTSRDNLLLLSSADRHLQTYDILTCNLLTDFKAFDADGTETAGLNAITSCSRSEDITLVAGVSNTDKSVRVYDDSGRLLACEYGHADGISSIALVKCGQTSDQTVSLVTVAVDGTVFLWSVSIGPESSTTGSQKSSSPNVVAHGPVTPLRRVLSSTEIARLQSLRISQSESPSSAAGADESPSLARARRPSKLSTSQTPNGNDSSATSRRALQAHVLPIPTSTPNRNSRQSPSPVRRFNSEIGTSPSRSRSRPGLGLQLNGGHKLDHRPELDVKAVADDESESTCDSRSIDRICHDLEAFRNQYKNNGTALQRGEVKKLEEGLRATLAVIGITPQDARAG